MTQATRPCPYCSAPMGNPRRKQCGKPECKRAFNADRMREYQRNYKAKHGHYQTRLYDKPRPQRYNITCAYCGKGVAVVKATSRYCTHRCWYDAKHASHALVELRWQPHIWLPAQPEVLTLKSLRRRWYSACCPMCETWFISDNPVNQCCSPRCGRRADKDKRRALQRQAYVAPVRRTQVYVRDRWTCQLCGKRVMRNAVVPHPKAPTIDHIVPLSKGGTHEPANVQLAHYYCNSIKADGAWGAGEQLALLG